MENEFKKGEIIIYESEDGSISLDTKLEDETIWLTQKQMAELFDVKIPAINKHLNNIYNENELKKDSTISILEIVQKEGSRNVLRNTAFYNLDAIIFVGYRVNSSRATQFRIWANKIIKNYITKGYALNEKILKTKQEQIKTLQSTISLLTRSIENQIETVNEAQNIAKILDNFSKGLNLLDNFDHKTLDSKGSTAKEAVIIEEKEYLEIINKMKSEFKSNVFANPKDNSFKAPLIKSIRLLEDKIAIQH